MMDTCPERGKPTLINPNHIHIPLMHLIKPILKRDLARFGGHLERGIANISIDVYAERYDMAILQSIAKNVTWRRLASRCRSAKQGGEEWNEARIVCRGKNSKIS
jgi:hypothetical protein